MADLKNERPVHVETDDARGGSTPGVTRYVLAASLVLVIIVMIVIYNVRS